MANQEISISTFGETKLWVSRRAHYLSLSGIKTWYTLEWSLCRTLSFVCFWRASSAHFPSIIVYLMFVCTSVKKPCEKLGSLQCFFSANFDTLRSIIIFVSTRFVIVGGLFCWHVCGVIVAWTYLTKLKKTKQNPNCKP